MNESIEKLRALPFFKGLTTDQLKVVAAACLVKRFKKSDTVIREGDTPDGMYVMISGTADVVKHGQTISQLAENDFFGELALLSVAKPRTATIIAAEDIETLFLPAKAFNNIKLGLSAEIFEEIIKRVGNN
ncbi:MAG: cyclic nucleotide-binding domain-containing protein [Patescibacteria group bacterium]